MGDHVDARGRDRVEAEQILPRGLGDRDESRRPVRGLEQQEPPGGQIQPTEVLRVALVLEIVTVGQGAKAGAVKPGLRSTSSRARAAAAGSRICSTSSRAGRLRARTGSTTRRKFPRSGTS
jgi:hypothetical protein